ncbi:hypothetical protein WMY93_001769 [Mugilogobius chulae]|uniref:Secreted protein n=1 Tax=Mugilogobius chulae TaxID=88201 RepID=A0AAW0PSZ3_9GOBI
MTQVTAHALMTQVTAHALMTQVTAHALMTQVTAHALMTQVSAHTHRLNNKTSRPVQVGQAPAGAGWSHVSEGRGSGDVRGLGMRYAFIGPMETMHLNAPEERLNERSHRVIHTTTSLPHQILAPRSHSRAAECVPASARRD